MTEKIINWALISIIAIAILFCFISLYINYRKTYIIGETEQSIATSLYDYTPYYTNNHKEADSRAECVVGLYKYVSNDWDELLYYGKNKFSAKDSQHQYVFDKIQSMCQVLDGYKIIIHSQKSLSDLVTNQYLNKGMSDSDSRAMGVCVSNRARMNNDVIKLINESTSKNHKDLDNYEQSCGKSLSIVY